MKSNFKNGTNELIYKTETGLQVSKANVWLPKGKCSGGGISQELGVNIHTLLYIRQIGNKDLLHSTGNPTQYSVITCMRKESENRIDKFIYMHN